MWKKKYFYVFSNPLRDNSKAEQKKKIRRISSASKTVVASNDNQPTNQKASQPVNMQFQQKLKKKIEEKKKK